MTYAELIRIKKNRRQTWFEITNLRREAITRGEGGSVHVYGFRRDLRQHVRLESNGLEFLMVFCVSEIFVLV